MAKLKAAIRAILRGLGFAVALFVVATEDLARLAISPVLAAIRVLEPWRRLEALVAALPPYGALAVLAVPELLFEPVKLLGLYWVAQGSILAGTAVFSLAKLVGMAIILRLHDIALPKLLSIGWYARLYRWVLDLRAWLYASVLAVPGVAAAIEAVHAFGEAARDAIVAIHRRYRRFVGRDTGI